MNEISELDMSVMNPSEVRDTIKAIVENEEKDISLMLWGHPGIGKSQSVWQAASELGISLVDVRLSLTDPVDFRLPDVKTLPDGTKITVTTRPGPEILPAEGRGILFWDEITVAPTQVQGAAFQIILDRKIGEHALGDGWYQVAASNLETDRSIVHRMPSALADRFVHVLVEPDVDTWLLWAHTNGIDRRITEFLAVPQNRDYLFKFDPETNYRVFPTPRGWEKVSKILRLTGISEESRRKLIAGRIGPEAASEFFLWLETSSKLPNPEDIIKGSIKDFSEVEDSIGSDAGLLYALSSGIAATYAHTVTNGFPAEKAAENTFSFILTVPSREFACTMGISVFRVHRELQRKGAVSADLKKVKSYVRFAEEFYEDLVDAKTLAGR